MRAFKGPRPRAGGPADFLGLVEDLALAKMAEAITNDDICRELRFAAGHRNSNHISALYLVLRDWGKVSPAAYRSNADLVRDVNRAKATLDADFPFGDSGANLGSALEYYDSSPKGRPNGV